MYSRAGVLIFQNYFDDYEFSYPLSWFDPEWECGYMGNGNADTATIPCCRST